MKLFVILVALAMFSINLILPESSQAVELKLAHFVPTSHAMHAEIIEPWAKEIEKLTEGRVKITIYPNATLAKPADLYDSAVTGIAELVYTLPSYTAGKFPLTEGLELPFIFNSAQHVTKTMYVLWDRVPEFRREYGDTKILWIWAGDPGQLFTKKPVRTVSDLKGLKIRVHGPTTKELASALGASPITSPVGEQYEMLKRGVIDGVFTPWSASMHFKLYEVTSYATVLNAYVPIMIVAMNKQAFEKLSATDRKIIEDTTGRKMAIKAAAVYDEIAKKSIEIHKRANVQIQELTREDFEKWRNAVAPVYSSWVAKIEAKGLPGKKFFDEMMKVSREQEK